MRLEASQAHDEYLQVVDSVKGVLAANTASKHEAIASWDGEQRIVSK